MVAAPFGLSLGSIGCGSGASASESPPGSASSGGAGNHGGVGGASGVGQGPGGDAGGDSGLAPATGAGAAAGDGSSGGGTGNPAQNVFVDRLGSRDGCLPRALPIARVAADGFDAGQVRCGVSFATPLTDDAPCTCDPSQNLTAALPGVAAAVSKNAELTSACGGETSLDCQRLCVCELGQASGPALRKCQTDAATPIDEQPPGFCYVDLNATPELGNAALVSVCPKDARRSLRVLGPAPATEPLMFVTCSL
jgi:hypothetical protein